MHLKLGLAGKYTSRLQAVDVLGNKPAAEGQKGNKPVVEGQLSIPIVCKGTLD